MPGILVFAVQEDVMQNSRNAHPHLFFHRITIPILITVGREKIKSFLKHVLQKVLQAAVSLL